VKAELVKLGFSRQHNRKTDEGSRHPDRNAQFAYINAKPRQRRRSTFARGPRARLLSHTDAAALVICSDNRPIVAMGPWGVPLSA
jgi:hypothetical protein